jgi:hypothetical protein
MEQPFDLAFSFASEDRAYVEAVKAECEKLGLTVYYDRDRKIDQWGKSFIAEQRKVYSGYRTKHFVPFISRHYFSKPIPTDEFKSALMESTKRGDYILPVKLDAAEVSVEYLHPDTQYLKKSDYTPGQLAVALRYVVTKGKQPAKDIDQLLTDELDLPKPKIIPRTYNKYREAELLLAFVAEQFTRNEQQLIEDGYSPATRTTGEKVSVLVERDGKRQFALNLFFTTFGDTRLGYNFDLNSMMGNGHTENGNIEPVFDKQQQKAGFVVMDYSGGAKKGLLTREEVVQFFWSKMLERLEQAFGR